MAFPTINMPERSLNKTLPFATRCRKRHFKTTMNILNLILLGCCLNLVLNPAFIQAKETTTTNSNNSKNNNATLKSENMLHVNGDDQMQVLNKNDKVDVEDQGVVMGTFKRLKPLDYKDLEQQLEDDIEKEQREAEKKELEEEAEDDDRSSEIIEMIQPAQHTLRHQEHYKQRILMAAKETKHFKATNKNNKNNEHNDRVKTIDIDNDENDGGEDDGDDEEEEDYDLEENERVTNQHNRNLRYQQIQLALREPTTTTTTTTNIPPLVHHHRRHEHHFVKQKMAKQTEFLWPQQHHLRHQHQQHHKQPTEPQELHHYSRKQNQTTNSKPSIKHQRYFDREISYAQPWLKLHSPTTEGPHLRHSNSNSNRYWKSISNPHNRLFNDEQQASLNDNKNENSKANANANDDDDDINGDDIKRITLSLQGHDTDDNKLKDLPEQNEQKPLDYKDNDPKNEQINKNQDYNDDLDEDYSYEDDNDENEDKNLKKSLKYPSIIAEEKTNVKRYTKPKTFTSTSYAYRSPATRNIQLRHSATIKSNLNMDTNDNDDYEEDNFNEDSDDSDEDNDDDKFTDEKWNKIEHEHYRKQLQHQRAMQALRARRPSTNDNTPKININRYASYTPPAAAKSASSSSFSAAWTKRQTVNEVSF